MSALKKPAMQRPLTPVLSPKGAWETVAVRNDIFAEVAHHRCRFAAVVFGDQDFILADLSAGVGQLAAQVTSNHTHSARPGTVPFNHRDILIRIAAHCVGWLDWLKAKDAFLLIDSERARQVRLFQAGHISFPCESAVVDAKRKLRVLVEEVGEVASAINKLEAHHSSFIIQPSAFNLQHLTTKLVQVAAVAVAWLETPVGQTCGSAQIKAAQQRRPAKSEVQL